MKETPKITPGLTNTNLPAFRTSSPASFRQIHCDPPRGLSSACIGRCGVAMGRQASMMLELTH